MSKRVLTQTAWKWVTALLISVGGLSHAQQPAEPALSAAEQDAVGHQIGMLRSPVDRQVAHDWSNAKKVAEFICRPAAMPVIRKQAKGVDRVFLGTDSAESLTLESDQRLTGSGTFRTPQGWQDFSFVCDLNAQTGKVMAFTPVLTAMPPAAKP